MNSSSDPSWTPAPELLAAFADGELESLPEGAELRGRISQWLAAHPEAAAGIEAQLALSRLLAATKPVEPGPAAWDAAWTQIEKAQLLAAKRRLASWRLAGLVVAGAAAAVLVVMISRQPVSVAPQATPSPSLQVAVVAAPAKADTVEVLKVAAADEVNVLHVAGADTNTLVVGHLPWSGPMVLVRPDEFEIRTPPADAAGMEIRTGTGSTPIIWMPLPGDNDDDQ